MVTKSSTVKRLKVVRALPALTQLALNAENKWRFEAATLNGEPTTSIIVAIALVFATPPPNN